VSSDQKNGKLNDPGKNREWPEISYKEGKSGNFYSMILFLKKKNCEVRFCLFFFFQEKNKTLF